MKNVIIILLSALTLLSCDASKASKGNVITVTIEPLRYFTEQIAGNKFEVKTMVPRGNSPETYEPTVRQLIDLSSSALYIKVGSIGFERTWMNKLKENAPQTTFIDTSVGIVPAKSINGITDPHTWMSCANAVAIAKNIYAAIVKEDSKNKEFYRQNLNKLIHIIQQTHSEIYNIFTKNKPKAFLIYHPSLTYFAREYGILQIPIEEEGREPSALQLQNVIKLAKKEGVKTMLVQAEFANRNTQTISKSTGAKVERINPLGYNWHKEMIEIAKKIR